MPIALCLSLLLTCTRSPIPVDLIVPADISSTFLSRLCAETEAIWRPAGVTFEWHRVSAGDEPPGRRLTVIVETKQVLAIERLTALGWITFTTNVPDPTIRLSRGAADLLLLELGGADDKMGGTPDVLIARALGRALAHEVGHYLWRTKGHTLRGLMRARWPSSELFAMNRGGFALTAAERTDAAGRLGGTR